MIGHDPHFAFLYPRLQEALIHLRHRGHRQLALYGQEAWGKRTLAEALVIASLVDLLSLPETVSVRQLVFSLYESPCEAQEACQRFTGRALENWGHALTSDETSYMDLTSGVALGWFELANGQRVDAYFVARGSYVPEKVQPMSTVTANGMDTLPATHHPKLGHTIWINDADPGHVLVGEDGARAPMEPNSWVHDDVNEISHVWMTREGARMPLLRAYDPGSRWVARPSTREALRTWSQVPQEELLEGPTKAEVSQAEILYRKLEERRQARFRGSLQQKAALDLPNPHAALMDACEEALDQAYLGKAIVGLKPSCGDDGLVVAEQITEAFLTMGADGEAEMVDQALVVTIRKGKAKGSQSTPWHSFCHAVLTYHKTAGLTPRMALQRNMALLMSTTFGRLDRSMSEASEDRPRVMGLDLASGRDRGVSATVQVDDEGQVIARGPVTIVDHEQS